MSEKKYVVIPFESAEDAAAFCNNRLLTQGATGVRLLDADEYPTKRYNGWTNYETWAVKLWMDNEEPSYRYWKEAAQEAWDEAPPLSEYAKFVGTEIFTHEQKAARVLAERLKEEWDEGMPEEIQIATNGTAYADLLNAALSEVNWTEIAESLLDEVDKVEAEEAES